MIDPASPPPPLLDISERRRAEVRVRESEEVIARDLTAQRQATDALHAAHGELDEWG